MKRVDTALDEDTIKIVVELAQKENRKPAGMIRVLVLEAIAARDNACKHEFIPSGKINPDLSSKAICRLCGFEPPVI